MNDEAQKFNVLKLIIQGKFIRINFDASGYIAGANIGKKWTFLWLGSFLRPLYSHLFFRDLLIGKSSNYQTGRGREILSHFLPTPDGSDQGVQMWVLWFYFPKLKQLQWLMQAWSFVMGHLWDLNCHSVRCERWGEGNVDPFLPSHYWNPPTLIFISTGKCCAPPTGLVMILGHRDTSQIMCTLVSGLGGKITIYKPKLLFLLLWTWAV